MNPRCDDKTTTRATEQKKRYQAPSLTSYGPVEKLTQGALGTMADGASGMGMA